VFIAVSQLQSIKVLLNMLPTLAFTTTHYINK